MINKIKYAIFDMDGTLVDSLMGWDVLWTSFGKKYLGREDFRPVLKDDKAVRTMTLKDAMWYIHNTYKMGADGDELLDAANKQFEDFYRNDVKLKAGVREFLDLLGANGVKMCIASATDMKLLKIALEHCDLNKYFDKIFSCAEIGKGKDEPDIFIKAMEFFGSSNENTCLFEDSLVAIETACKMGLPTVGIYDKYNYGQERMREIATEYIAEGETLMKLV